MRVEQRSAIKIRLVTFNMHDSLPEISGDLSEFLGEMGEAWSDDGPRWKGPQTSTAGSVVEVPSPTSLPAFPLDPDHPYHLIVVAGQECKSSGALQGIKTDFGTCNRSYGEWRVGGEDASCLGWPRVDNNSRELVVWRGRGCY